MPDISAIGFDATVRHAVLLEQLKAGQARTLIAFLREIDEELRLRLGKGELTAFARNRLEKLLASVDENLDGILSRFEGELTKELRDLATLESKFEASSLTEQVQNTAFEATVPSPRQVWAAATAAPLSIRGVAGGQLMEGFIKHWSQSQRDLLVGGIRRGVFEGQTNGEILRAIRGSAGGQFRDGILGQSYRQSQAMIRTAVQHVSHQARLETMRANSDLVTGYRWVSTLDNRTTEICQALSGETFEIDKGPVPPAHINCRSTIVPLLDERFDFLKEGRTQASQFGPVDQNETYYSWLKQQPEAFQNQVLGPIKGKLFRDGGLSTEDFQRLVRADNYTPITLAEMQRLQPLAFERAGIRILPSGRAVIGGGAQSVIQAVRTGQFGLEGPDKKQRTTPEMNKWRKSGTFETPRLKSLEAGVDDPRSVLTDVSGGAYYRSSEELISMARYSEETLEGRSVMRHEWGHYLDDKLARLAAINSENTFAKPLIMELAGEVIDGFTSRFISGWSKPVAALRGDAKKLLRLGARVWKQMDPGSKVRAITGQRTVAAWDARRRALVELGAEGVEEARASLEKSQSIIGRAWRQIKAAGDPPLSMVDAQLFAEADAAGDLSVLFMDRGKYLKAALSSIDSHNGSAVYGALTDLLGAATKEDFGGHLFGWGHGKAYYAKGGMHNQATEAFAEMTTLEEARRSSAFADDLVRALMPEFTAWYDELIDGLNGLISGG